ncbi:MAG: hypothetical protein IT205_09470 [Fimbriimonadaceae bacterium]|nr:hypothetical protein [Fimbriimonadaceae bacterium]
MTTLPQKPGADDRAIGAALVMENQENEQRTKAVTLSAHALSELNHGLKLAFALSFDQGIEGQHLRTAVWQFLSHLELDHSEVALPLRLVCREISLARAMEMIR